MWKYKSIIMCYSSLNTITMFKKLKKFFKILGPGFITGASDDDPSGIATYAQTGAQFGYSQSWFALFSVPFMITVQEMCGRIALATGKGLAGVMRRYYTKKLLYFTVILLVIANTINIGADLGAMASAAQLIIPLPFFALLCIATFSTLLLEIFVSYKVYARYLKYLALSLFAYIIVAFVIPEIRSNLHAIAISTLLPHIEFNKAYFLNITALLGTTISPYMFFWQAEEEVEEAISARKILPGVDTLQPTISQRTVKNLRIDTTLGMVFSNVVTLFIIITSAATLGTHGITTVNTASDAAQALLPLGGKFATLLFALGIVGTGLLAVPILAGSASYALAEAFQWKNGLYRKFSQAHGFYGIITLSTIIGLAISTSSIPPFRLLYYTSIVNGIIAPFLIIVIIGIASNKKIMGSYANRTRTSVVGWLIACLMIASIIGLIIG